MVKKKVVPRKSLDLGTTVNKTNSSPYIPNFVIQGATIEVQSHGIERTNLLRANIDMKEKIVRESQSLIASMMTNQETAGSEKEMKHFDGEWKPNRKKYLLSSYENQEKEEKEPVDKDRDKEKKEKTKSNKHPLADYVNLSDLQVIITEALLFHGEPCSFEKLNEFVSNEIKERDIRRKDGTPYAADCRRAIQANLRITSNHLLALYKKDANGMWSLCHSLEEAKKIASTHDSQQQDTVVTTPIKSTLKLINSRERNEINTYDTHNDSMSKARSESHDHSSSENMILDNDFILMEDFIPGPRTRAQERTLKSIVQPVLLSSSQQSRDEELISLTLLQKFISLFIIANSDIASIDSMEDEAKTIWPKALQGLARRCIVMCLLNQNSPILFIRNPEFFSNWQLSESHPWYEIPSEDIKKKEK